MHVILDDDVDGRCHSTPTSKDHDRCTSFLLVFIPMRSPQ
jgi:hypothetical protein